MMGAPVDAKNVAIVDGVVTHGQFGCKTGGAQKRNNAVRERNGNGVLSS